MRKIALLFAMAIFSTALVIAQNQTVSGKVLDEQGKPIPFSSVKEKGTKIGVIADANGFFTIDVKSSQFLIVSSVGFIEKGLKISDPNHEIILSKLSIRLRPRQRVKQIAFCGDANGNINLRRWNST